MRDVIAYLIGKTITMNARKQEVETDTRTEIMALYESVSQSEFYKGGEAGLKPEFRLNPGPTHLLSSSIFILFSRNTF